MDDEAKLNQLLEALSPLQDTETNEAYILKQMAVFEKEICWRYFTNKSFSQAIEALNLIFRCLFTCSIHSSTTVRLEASRALSVFLTRILPFAGDKMQESFSRVLKTLKFRTPLTVAAFAFISRYISAPFLLQFIKLSPIIDHFVVNDSVYATAIENMDLIGNSFLVELLTNKLMPDFMKEPNRHLVRAIGTIVKHSPSLFFPMIAHLKSLPLFAYVFTNVDMSNVEFDPHNIIEFVFEKLQNPSTSPIDLDNSLQILATMSQFLETSVELAGEESLLLRIAGMELTFMYKKMLSRPSLYLLPVPLDLLKPRDEESVLILTAKFRTLSRMMCDENSAEILEIFDSYLSHSYSERVSAAIIGFSECVPKLSDCEIVNKVVFEKATTWFHAFDILRVVSKLPFREHFLEIIHSFLLMNNERLADAAIQTLQKMTTDDNFDIVFRYFGSCLDPFDANNYAKVLQTLSSLITNEKRSHDSIICAKAAIKMAIESLDLYRTDLPVLGMIYRFLAKTKLTFLADIEISKLTENAVKMIESYYDVICGNVRKEPDEIYELVREEVLDQSFDLLEQFKSFEQFLPCFSAVVEFLYSIPFAVIGAQRAIDLSGMIFSFYPNATTTFLCKNWHRFTDTQRMPFMSKIYTKLQLVSDIEVMYLWCKIALVTRSLMTDKTMDQIIGFLHVEALTYLEASPESMEMAELFCRYLLKTMAMGSYYVRTFLTSINEKQRQNFANIAAAAGSLSDYTEIMELKELPEDNSDKGSDVMGTPLYSAPKSSEEFRRSMNIAIFMGNTNAVKSLLAQAKTENWNVNMREYRFPSYLNKLITGSEQVLVSPEEAISLSRSIWSRKAAEVFEANHIKILRDLSNSPKVKRNVLLDLTAILQFSLTLDSTELMKFACQMALSSTSNQRMRVTLLLLATVIARTGIISQTVASDIVNRLNENFQEIPKYQMALCLREASRHIQVDATFLYFTWKLARDSCTQLPEYSILNTVLRKDMLILSRVNKKLQVDFEPILIDHLNGTLPSKYIAGLRMLLIGKMKHTLNPLMDTLDTFYKNPFVNSLAVDVIRIHSWRERFRKLEKYLTIHTSQAECASFARLYRYFVQSLIPNDPLYETVSTLTSSRIDNIHDTKIFDAMYETMEKIIEKTPVRDRQSVAMVYFVKFIGRLTEEESYFMGAATRKLVKLVAENSQPDLMFQMICMQLARTSRSFTTTFPIIAHYYMKASGNQWRDDFASMGIQVLTNRYHKLAIEALQKGMIKEATALSKLYNQCEEGDRLAAEVASK